MAGTLENIDIDIRIVLGTARLPIHRMLRRGRGSVIELQTAENDEVEIFANDVPIARGLVIVNGNSISVEIIDLIRKPEKVQAMSDHALAHAG